MLWELWLPKQLVLQRQGHCWSIWGNNCLPQSISYGQPRTCILCWRGYHVQQLSLQGFTRQCHCTETWLLLYHTISHIMIADIEVLQMSILLEDVLSAFRIIVQALLPIMNLKLIAWTEYCDPTTSTHGHFVRCPVHYQFVCVIGGGCANTNCFKHLWMFKFGVVLWSLCVHSDQIWCI